MATTVVTAPQIHQIAQNEVRTVVVSFDGKQNDGDTLTGTPSVSGAAAVAPSSVTIISDPLTIINNKRVTANKAVRFTVAANLGITGTDILTVSCDSTSNETLVGYITLEVVDA